MQPFQADAPSGRELAGAELLACADGDTWVTAGPLHRYGSAPQPSPFPPPALCTHGGFFPTPSLGAFLQTLEEYMSPAGPRGAPSPAVWASLPRQKNQTDFVTGSNTHTSNPSPSLPAGTSARVCPSESGRWTHHRVMEEQLPGLVKFLIAQHVHKVFKEITWDQRGHEQRRGPGRTVPSDPPTPHPSRVCT